MKIVKLQKNPFGIKAVRRGCCSRLRPRPKTCCLPSDFL